jgi:hypothetical protein
MLDRTNSCNGFGVWWQAQEVARMNMILVPEIADEAKALVALAFRNGPIEDLHAGAFAQPAPAGRGSLIFLLKRSKQ